jgi:subtilisin family serine protease
MLSATTSPANAYGSQAAELWQQGITGSDNVYVAVIDTGGDITHPDLAANMWVNPFDPVDSVDNDGNGYVDDVNGWDFYEIVRPLAIFDREVHDKFLEITFIRQAGTPRFAISPILINKACDSDIPAVSHGYAVAQCQVEISGFADQFQDFFGQFLSADPDLLPSRSHHTASLLKP